MGNRAERTAAACSRTTCNGCELHGRLLCLHTPLDLMDFGILFIGYMIPYLTGMIVNRFWIGLGVWVLLAAVFFIYVEALVLCRHCPHYAEPGSLLSCHANWGLPKLPPYSPRPLNSVEKSAWLVYGAVLFLYYIPFFIYGREWLFLLFTTSALVVAVWTVQRTQCTRCYHLSCPANRVPDEVRSEFFKYYPDFAGARSEHGPHREG